MHPNLIRSISLRLDVVGREIQRAAVAMATARANRRDAKTSAPTCERLQHGQRIEQYDGAVADAGVVGYRVIEACLLDALKESGMLDGEEPSQERHGRRDKPIAISAGAALRRHSAGLWLRALFHESGMMRSVTMRYEGVQNGGDPTGAAVFETSDAASATMTLYQSVMRAMETRDLYAPGVVRMVSRQKRRATHAVREIACWDRWPSGYTVGEVRMALDRLAALQETEIQE